MVNFFEQITTFIDVSDETGNFEMQDSSMYVIKNVNQST